MFCISLSISAQTTSFSCQGLIIDGDESLLLSNQNIGLEFSILSQGHSTLYTEIFNTTTNQAGAYNIKIGSGEVSFGNFDNIVWGVERYTLNITTDLSGGTNYPFYQQANITSVNKANFSKSSNRVYPKNIIERNAVNNAQQGDVLFCSDCGSKGIFQV
ncbi:hypothetical protein ACXGQW_06855 [Wenyingzhuangia sp. IMCC45533]